MTKIGRLASLLLLGIFGSTYAQVTKKQPPKQPLAATSPSLNETTDFIVGKLDGLTAVFEFYFTFSGKRALDVQGEQITAPRATECQLTWVQSRILRCHIPNVPSSCGGGGTVRFAPTLQLSEMSPTVKVLPTPDPGNTDLKIVRGVYALVLDATHDQQVTSESIDDNKMFPQNDYATGRYVDSYDNSLDFSQLERFRTGTTSRVSKQFDLMFPDRDTAERVAKAFAHAIELCGGKKEPF